MEAAIWRVLAWRWTPCLALSAGSLLFALSVAALVPEQLGLVATSTARIEPVAGRSAGGSESSSFDSDPAAPATHARPLEAETRSGSIPFEPAEATNPAPVALPEPPPPVATPEPPAEPPPVATPEPPAEAPPPAPSIPPTQNQSCLIGCQGAFQSCMAPSSGALANISECQEHLASCREGCR